MKTILLRARKQVFCDIHGGHISNSLGDGLDFLELREYGGGDVKYIDWKRSARMGKPYERKFHKEKALKLAIVNILSPSLAFGSKRIKQDIVAEISAIFGYSALKNRDIFRFINWQNAKTNFSTPCKSFIEIEQNVAKIYNSNLLNQKQSLDKFDDELLKILGSKSLVVIISDFYDIPNLSKLSKKHEVVCIVVRDIFEEKPKNIGNFRILNTQSLTQSDISFTPSYSKTRNQEILAHDEELFSYLSKLGVKSFKIYTHENIYTKLKAFMR